ncbi:MAG: VOC family protein [Pseudomonadota bacterium]
MFTARALLIAALALASVAATAEEGEPEAGARLSGTTIITGNLERSVAFYTDVLDFETTRVRPLEAEASRAVYGLPEGREARYTTLLPKGFDRDNPQRSSLNLLELKDWRRQQIGRGARSKPHRKPALGEIVLAFSVPDVAAIAERAAIFRAPIVTPLARSASGRSMTLTLLDPNGVRVHLYSYQGTE